MFIPLLFVLITHVLSTPLYHLDKNTALAFQAATRHKFRNAPALLRAPRTSPRYLIHPSLQHAYDRASDDATNFTLLASRFTSDSSPFTLARAGSLGCLNNTANISLLDDTDDVDDFEYYGPLHFGSHAQSLQIDFDTGSADLWVPVGCRNCAISSFQPAASTSFHDTGKLFRVTYGSGYVTGTLAQDTVSVGPFNVYNQSFGAATQVSPSFSRSPSDGLAGLAFSSIATSQQPTLFENLIPQLAAPLFSFYMTRAQPRGSQVCFGGIDPSKVKGNSTVSWVKLTAQTYWTVNMTGVLVQSLIHTNLSVILDTGTSFIYVPDEIATAIYDQIPGSAPAPDFGSGFYAYPCDTNVAVSFVLDTTPLALDPRDLTLGPYTSDRTGRMCIASIIAVGSMFDSNTFAILGDSFLKSYLSIFDYSHGARVGFLESKNE